VLALAAGCAALLAGCAEPETPESRVRAALAQLETAAETGDVSDAHQDALGHDKRQLRDFVRFHMLRNPGGRELLLRVRSIQLTSERTASVMLHAGLAGASP
jgi:hypothetical protein